ncbi:hypothetical protein [Streptomyces echinatus]|uniref:Uncharacterized protein n=1 Tax=Streptomyces echinatus TaxID=67293 RepID=A0A7W9Q1Q4_9ACTN|nr:hypothetical protein [Streptomyces echinatus]MBB5931999.1 hypothetical protein [Streptomyces echinatus]
MRLERGATGFRGPGDARVPETDATLFRSACWNAARGIGGRVSEPARAEASSFHWVIVTSRAAPYVVLCHAHLPIVAFAAASPVPGQPLSAFVDPPPWGAGFEVAGFRCLLADHLNTPMSRLDVTGLAEAELMQIRYWRPEKLSDLLFNWWD